LNYKLTVVIINLPQGNFSIIINKRAPTATEVTFVLESVGLNCFNLNMSGKEKSPVTYLQTELSRTLLESAWKYLVRMRMTYKERNKVSLNMNWFS